MGYAPHHFQRLFKRDLGVSPAEYARGLRSKRAEAALKQNGRVTDAIYDAGYSSAERLLQRCEREARNDPIGLARRRPRSHHTLDDVRQSLGNHVHCRDGEGHLPADV